MTTTVDREAGVVHRRRTRRLAGILALAAMVLIVLGVKFLFIGSFGSSIPYWDQWDAEADLLYRSYLNSGLSLSLLASSHNEHRIAATRLFSLVLFELNGGWDPVLQMVANALLHVGAIVLLTLLIRRIVRPTQFVLLVAFSTLLFALPIGWENLLAGFQSQFYFLLIFSLLALSGFAGAAALSLAWWGSLACAIAGYFSMASGALTVAAALAIVIVQIILGQRKGKAEYAGAGVLLCVMVVMLVFVRNIPAHDVYKAHSVTQFVSALLSCLSFPRSNPAVGLWLNLPAVVYALALLKVRPERSSPHWAVLGLVVWLLGQSVSLSYGRAVGVNSSRYLDLIIVGLPLNFGILLFAQDWLQAPRERVIAVAATVAWLGLAIPGLIWTTITSSYPAVVERSMQGHEQQNNVLAYMNTGDRAVLQGKPMLAIPYPDPQRLASLLSDAEIRRFLPDAIRPANSDHQSMVDDTFLKGRLRPAATRVKQLFLTYAHVLVGIGIALAFGVASLLCGRYD